MSKNQMFGPKECLNQLVKRDVVNVFELDLGHPDCNI